LQAPQVIVAPQPLPVDPQLSPSEAQDSGVHVPPLPHWYGLPPPPHVFGATQPPQEIVPPQPSLMSPQLAPNCAQVPGTHTGVLHACEQQSVFAVHAVPVPWHDLHMPLEHRLEQQLALLMQLPPPGTHIWQTLLTQVKPEQQRFVALHAWPGSPHWQAPLTQVPTQHCASAVHPPPWFWHMVHFAPLQNVPPPHCIPQAPQLAGSLVRSWHNSSVHVTWPGTQTSPLHAPKALSHLLVAHMKHAALVGGPGITHSEKQFVSAQSR
jgi:hypothetical protein